MHPFLLLLLLLCVAAPAARAQDARDAEYLYVWSTAVDTAGAPGARPRPRGVFLATVDLREGSPTRGRVVGVVAADTTGGIAHHTEHALAGDGLLFASDFRSGRTHRFDLRTPGGPRLLGVFSTAGPLGYPHSYVPLPGGTVLATYQWQASGEPPGGIAELRRDGTVARWASAATAGVDSALLHPYSLEVIPALDRVVTTSNSMRGGAGVHVQVWRLSDLALLHTLPLPEAPPHEGHDGHAAGAGGNIEGHIGAHHLFPGEPRLLADGRTVMVGTFTCGLYRLAGIDGPAPRLEFAHALPGRGCALPVRVGRWWIQTVPALRALVALDLSDPVRPREVSRLVLDAPASPHWLAADPAGRRLVVTSSGGSDPRVYLVALDPETGALAAEPGVPLIDLSRVPVPGIGTVRAIPHGSVFGPGRR